MIRKATVRDLREISKVIEGIPLYRRYGVKAENLERLFRRALRDRNSDVRVWREGRGRTSRCLGVVWMQKHAAFARSHYLRLIAVDPLAHRAGIGRKLMAWAESNYLHPHGIFLLMSARNTQARRFYTALGYRGLGRLPHYVQRGLVEEFWYKGPK